MIEHLRINKGLVQTVSGSLRPEELGVTLMHEHLFVDGGPAYFQMPKDITKRKLAVQPLSLENLAWVKYNQTSNEDNMRLDDEEMIASEIMRFKYAGGETIVDVSGGYGFSAQGSSRSPESLRKLARMTGLHVVAGTGYYVSTVHPDMDKRTVSEIADEFIRDITVGIQGTTVKAGIIGEIGTTYPWGSNEQKVLQASVRAQLETGVPLTIHPGRNPRHPDMILEVLEKEGADFERVIIDHVERTVSEFSDLERLLKKGCYLEYDLFGQYWYPFDLEFPFPSDSMRIFQIKKLLDAGYADKVLLSHDIDSKYLLYRFGGHGYAHLLENIVPVMLRTGISQQQVEEMLVRNPARILALV